MKRHELGQFFRWSLYGAVVGLGVVGTQLAIAQVAVGRVGQGRPAVDLGGARIVRAQLTPGTERDTFEIVLARAEGTSGNFQGTFKFMRREFKGDMLSRVPRAGDIVDTVLESKPFRAPLPAVGEKSFTTTFDLPTGPKSKGVGFSYVVRLVVDNQFRDVAFASVSTAPSQFGAPLPKLSQSRLITRNWTP